MKAQTGLIGTFANGTAERKSAAEITTTPKASRRSFRSAGRLARNAGGASLDRDTRYRPFRIPRYPPREHPLRKTLQHGGHVTGVLNHIFGAHRGRGRGQIDTADGALASFRSTC